MHKTKWSKLAKAARDENYTNTVIDALEDNCISAEAAKIFLNPKESIYGLVLTDLEKVLKDTFAKYTGVPYTENSNDNGIEKVAYESIISILANDTKTYGPSFNLIYNDKDLEILVVTEQAIKALNIDPAQITNTIPPNRHDGKMRPSGMTLSA